MQTLATFPLGSGTCSLRRAVAGDVPALVDLLAADQFGSTRETDPERDPAPYQRAFRAIDADPAQLLVVLTIDGGTEDGTVVGTLQLTFIPGLARRGAMRAQVEAVRVHEAYRGIGLGGEMLTWAIAEARRRGCAIVQLTADKRRTDAHRFYERLGFVASHEGLKLHL